MGLKENEDFQIIDMFFTGPCGWVTTVFEKGTQFAYLKDTENKNFAKLAYLYLQV